MDLKNNKITVGELVKNPKVMEIFNREFKGVVSPVMIKMASGMSLEKLLLAAKKHIEADKIEKILKEIETL